MLSLRLRRIAQCCSAVAALLFAPPISAMDVRSLWDFTDPARSEAVFRERLKGATGDDALVLQTQIARTYGLRSRFDDAHALLDQIEPKLARAGAEPRVRYLLERGRTWRSSKRPEPARPLFVQAVELATTAKLDELAVDAMHMVALLESAPEAQMHWNQRALALAQSSTDPNTRNWDASLANNIGWTLRDQGRDEEALASFRTALAARERIGRPADIRSTRWMIASTLRAMGRFDEALVELRRLEREQEQLGEPDGFVFEELAENLLAQRKTEEAKPYFLRAWEVLSRDTSLDRPDDKRLQRLRDLGH